MPRTSILMTARNSEATIGRAVRSTLRAMGDDAELVVLDDGSTDETVDVIDRIRDRRLRLVPVRHMGIAAGLNHLLGATSSELVGRMDADDVCFPWRLAREHRALSAGADVVFTTVVDFGPGARFSAHRPRGIGPEAFRFRLLLDNPVAHPTMLAKRSVIEDAGGYRELPLEDYDLWLRLASSGASLRRLALPGLGYRMHDGQVTASAAWRAQSIVNEEISLAYGELSSLLLGEAFPRLVTLAFRADLTAAKSDAVLDDFHGRFVEAIAGLPRRDGADLRRMSLARIQRIRSGRVVAPTGLPPSGRFAV